MTTIHEPARDTPVCHECDVCVIGGSPTGVFAAIAAARLGAKVAIVEALGGFGGTATASMVIIWHKQYDEPGRKRIVAGLPYETMERLKKRNAVDDCGPVSHHRQHVFNPAELMIEFDEMIKEAGVRPFLHARFVAPVMREDGEVEAVVIEDKSGRRAIKAGVFVDASGDGDLAHRAGFEMWRNENLQPPTTCAVLQGMLALGDKPDGTLRSLVFDPKYPNALRPGFLWGTRIPGQTDTFMVAGTRIHGANCADADELTKTEIEGRRQVRAMLDIVRQQPGGENVALLSLAWMVGIRDTRHTTCLHKLTEKEVLSGQRFPDAIANGSYRVDVHFADGDGLVFRYLNGEETTVRCDGTRETSRWLPDGQTPATFYQVPYRCLVPRGSRNVLVAGRCVDADEGAYGAIRVQINCAQMGQAAGVAAQLALDSHRSVAEVDTDKLRHLLADQGALVI